MSFFRSVRLALLAPALLLVGCSDDDGDGGFTPGENAPPVVNITSPADGSRFDEGEPVALGGTALDAEDGMLGGESVVWSSDKDGILATGTTVAVANLSVGDHTITLTATDSDFATGDDVISIGIDARPPEPPTASITQPMTDDTFAQGEQILFIGTGSDPDGADLEEEAFVWTSDVNGLIGVGRQVGSNTLAPGPHLIVLTVTDPQGLTGTAAVLIEINP
ncbi:MAG: Ig-like domain-containing protein [marine benthic group bacterium]|nr:Ig-like domain-containing protein [Gemmatimonadota bacterium]